MEQFFFADLHLHSPWSMATDRNSSLENIWVWAQLIGVDMVGSSDALHPQWQKVLKEKLELIGNGVYQIQDQWVRDIRKSVPKSCWRDVRFLITAEIVLGYRSFRNQKAQFHVLLVFPSLAIAEEVSRGLLRLGVNLDRDGRPFLAFHPRNLVDLLFSIDPEILIIPSHIWTPWFGILGERCHFSSIQEGWEDAWKYVSALETGLSSDILMNSLVSSLDQFPLVSFSDAHSPENLGRNCTEFFTTPDFPGIRQALRHERNSRISRTIDTYPELGKYHFDGHRRCLYTLDPKTLPDLHTKVYCPKCTKPLTIGVFHRVLQLADRKEPITGSRCWSFWIPLSQIVCYILGIKKIGKRGLVMLQHIREVLGPDLQVVLNTPLEKLDQLRIHELKAIISGIRQNKIRLIPGYDGSFGNWSLIEEST